jgi:hypothetical protein
MRALAERDAGKDPSDPSTVRISAASIREGDEGHLLGYEVLSEPLVHSFERTGRGTFLIWVEAAITESKRDPIRLVRVNKGGGLECLCWVTVCIKFLLIGYREFLAKRRPNWLPSALMDLLVGPHHPWPLRDAPDSTTNLLAFFVVLGLLTLVDEADEDGDIATDSLIALEEGVKAFLRAWKATYVASSGNRTLWDKVPKNLKDAAQAEADAAPAERVSGGRTARGAKRKGAVAGAVAASAAANGAGAHSGNLTAAAPPAAAAAGAAAPRVAATGTTATANPRPVPPAVRVEGPARTFSKCHWIGPDGSSCTRSPPSSGTVAFNSPLCHAHRAELAALTGPQKASVAAKMRASGVPIIV